jgi:ribosomal protein S18 acetylase RimI-like enzyme
LNVTIRPGTPEDAVGITRVFLESAEHHARLDPECYFVPDAETISAIYREGHAEGTTLVAEDNGEIVGFVDVHLSRFPDPMHQKRVYCHITEIAVRTQHQSHGIGRELLIAAEEWGRQQGASYGLLEFHPANTRAAEFYQQRMGYRPSSTTVIKRL